MCNILQNIQTVLQKWDHIKSVEEIKYRNISKFVHHVLLFSFKVTRQTLGLFMKCVVTMCSNKNGDKMEFNASVI